MSANIRMGQLNVILFLCNKLHIYFAYSYVNSITMLL